MADGARHKAAERAGKRIRLLELSESFVEHDWCTKGHAGYLLDGDLEIAFEARVEQFAQGDGFIIRSGTDDRHKARALRSRALLLIVEDA